MSKPPVTVKVPSRDAEKVFLTKAYVMTSKKETFNSIKSLQSDPLEVFTKKYPSVGGS